MKEVKRHKAPVEEFKQVGRVDEAEDDDEALAMEESKKLFEYEEAQRKLIEEVQKKQG